MICPCRNCENKGCGIYHDKCEKYLQFVEFNKTVNRKKREEAKTTALIIKRRSKKWNKKS